MHKNYLIAAAASLALLGCAAPPSASTSTTSDPGSSKTTAIEVCRPQGQRAYLERLRCSDGSTPNYRRIGSFGGRHDLPTNLSKAQESLLLDRAIRGTPLQPGEPDYHVVDGYELACGAARRVVYMDMYHCNQPPPSVAPAGLTLGHPARPGSP